MKRHYSFLLFSCFVAFSVPLAASAQSQPNNFVPLATYTGSQLQGLYGSNAGGATLDFVLNHFLGIALSLVWIIVVGRWIYAGFLIGSSGDSWEKQQKARQIISDSTIWALAASAVFLIFSVIDPCSLDINRIFDDLKGGGSGGSCTQAFVIEHFLG